MQFEILPKAEKPQLLFRGQSSFACRLEGGEIVMETLDGMDRKVFRSGLKVLAGTSSAAAADEVPPLSLAFAE